jgi:large subunit ribosomal protein L19
VKKIAVISAKVGGKARRAKLNYLRQRTGKAAKVKELVR